jgi:hypothetical protein
MEEKHLFMQQGHCFWVNWQRTRYGGLPGTLLARRDLELGLPQLLMADQKGLAYGVRLRRVAI